MEFFRNKNISPMLIAENKPAFDSPDYIYELKFDGTRAIAYVEDNHTAFRNKRNKILDPLFPELSKIHQQANKRCILDGEIIVMKDGKPNFSQVQTRCMMSNHFKINLAAQKLPASFIVFDILYLEDQFTTELDLLDRKELLEKTITNSERLTKSLMFNVSGTAFFNYAKEQNLEGIIAKKKNSKYYPGKRTKEWIKCKAFLDEDFIVCGYYFKAENFLSVVLGAYEGNQLVYIGHVVMGIAKRDFQLIKSVEAAAKENYYSLFPDFDGAVWLKPELVCVVEFMEYTKSGGLRQPVYRGLRKDKSPLACRLTL